jgi:hypothetical protein
MPPRRPSAALAVTTVAAFGAFAAPSALARSSADTVPLSKAGSTSLKLDKGTAKALSQLGISVGPVKPAKVKGGALKFPITGGRLDPRDVGPAQILHSGGLRLAKGKTHVKLTNPTIRVGTKATMSAVVGGTRAVIGTLDPSKAKITRPRTGGPTQIATKVSKVGVNLSGTGAKALDAAFKTKAFKAGLKLGTAVVDARPSRLILESGTTALTVDPGAATLLTGAGITPGVVAPGTIETSGAFAFPIKRSVVAAGLASGTIGHTGGISLTKAPTSLALTDFDIGLGAAPDLSASVNGGMAKASIANLDLSGAQIDASGKTGIVVSGVTLTVSDTASSALTATFGTPSTAGATLGTAVVTAQAR